MPTKRLADYLTERSTWYHTRLELITLADSLRVRFLEGLAHGEKMRDDIKLSTRLREEKRRCTNSRGDAVVVRRSVSACRNEVASRRQTYMTRITDIAAVT